MSGMIAQKKINGDMELPAFPRVVMQLIDMLRNPNIDSNKIEKALRTDPIVAVEVLRFANSALYAPTEPINDLRHSISFLGYRRLHSLMLGIATKVAGGKLVHPRLNELLWRHSVASGFLTMYFGRELRLDHETAFLSGLLHDIGKIAVAAVLARLEKKMGIRVTQEDRVVLVEIHHETVGMAVAQHWPLPEAVVSAICCHHGGEAPARDRTLVAAVELADRLSYALGYGSPIMPFDVFAIPALTRLNWNRELAEEIYSFAVPLTVAELNALTT